MSRRVSAQNAKKWAYCALVGVSLSALAGCTNFTTAMREAKPDIQGTPYHQFLYHGYVDLAEAESNEHDFADAGHFRTKAAMAEAGATVSPDDPSQRDIEKLQKLVAFTKRARLMNYLEGRNTIALYPAISAKAVVAYDCWLQEVEENIQPLDIKMCREELDKQMARLAGLSAPVVEQAMKDEAVEEKTVGNEVTEEKAAVDKPAAVIVYFAFNSTRLSPSALRKLDQFVSALGDNKHTSIKVVGYADRSGSGLVNLGLSQDRADAVVDALKARGLGDHTFLVTARGENNPQVQTADGVKERLNRRVVIKLIH